MSLLKFKDIKQNNIFDFGIFIKDIDKYLAHLSLCGSELETLLAHSNLVLDYALKLINVNDLENVIDNAICNIANHTEMQNDIKLFFLKAIYWHDIGKINENFQTDKMQNEKFKSVENSISSKHSILGAYLYLASCFNMIKNRKQETQFELITISLVFAAVIWRHHSGINKSIGEFLTDENEGLKSVRGLKGYLAKANIDKVTHQLIFDFLVDGDLKRYLRKSEEHYVLSKSLFSLLIISDYYATAQFMNYGNIEELIYKDFGLIDDEFRDKVYGEFYTDKFDKNSKQLSFNQALKNKKKSDFKNFGKLQKKSNDNLNELRNKLFVEVKTNLLKKENIRKNLFYIEAPTGAGKTNLSVMSAVEILQQDKTINKIFYVFPFTTLITQTYDAVKSVLNLDNSQIVQLHSKAKYNDKREIREDGVYGDEKSNFLDNQFMNYPITLLSHVRFFDVLTGVSKDDNYIFHRLANSVVIIDEIQTYSPDLWLKIVYMLDSFASKFNIKFIVMSATLPKIGKLLVKEGIDDKFVRLVENKEDYFTNPNFAGRIIEIKEIDENSNEKLYEKLMEESRTYQEMESNKSKKVKTIIEFITKKGADKFYHEAKEKKKLFDEIFILSGTILEPRRREIIDILKNVHDENILLITTQVVEAGVDIDMDIGFKEKSLVDSDEQLAGRINRNSSKEGSKLFLFEMEKKNANFVYKGDKRLKAQKDNNLSLLKIEGKNFDSYYDQVIKKIKSNNEVNYIDNLNSYIDHVKNLRFSEVHIKIINIKSLSVFVPWCSEAIEVWNEYKEMIQNQEMDFTQRQIRLHNLASKISNYTFSLAIYQGSGIDYLKQYGEEELGYLYLKDWENISGNKQLYTYEDGLDTRVLSGENVSLII